MNNHGVREPNGAQRLRIRAAAAADWRGTRRGPLELTLRKIDPEPDPAGSGVLVATRVDIESIEPVGNGSGVPAAVVVPAFVNAHTHLDLSLIGPRPLDHAGGFSGWLGMIRAERPAEDTAIAEAVRRGVALSRSGGVAAVGDIAGATGGRPNAAAWRALRGLGVAGVSFLEFFAIGAGEAAGLRRLTEAAVGLGHEWHEQGGWSTRLGLQPHAPYSVGLKGYRLATESAARLGERVRLATHLAETAAEVEFVARGTGHKRAFLETLGLWDERAAREVGRGRTPVEHLEPAFNRWRGRWLAAHGAGVTAADIGRLARAGVSVAYCPRSAAYFGTPAALGPHPWRAMLAGGVNVCLGTDSVVNLDTPGRISTWDEAALLAMTAGGLSEAEAAGLLAMITVNGAAAIGADPGLFTLEAGRAVSGLVLVETAAGSDRPLAAALENRGNPEPVIIARASVSEEVF